MKKSSKLTKVLAVCFSALLVVGAISLPNLFGTSAALVVTHCDVNRDGIINGKDVLRVMKYLKTSDYYFPDKADVNSDGAINSADIDAIRSFYGQTCEIVPDRLIDPTVERPTYDELVARILEEARKVVDFTSAHGFNYGNPTINPAYNWFDLDINKGIDQSWETGKLTACNRLVSWVFQRAGYTDQKFYWGGFTDEDYARYGFQRINDVNDVRAGDIVLVNNTFHQFICAGTNLRYDHGSATRIQRVAEYAAYRGNTEPFAEPIIGFTYAWRPNPAGLPASTLTDIYKKHSANVARPASYTETVYTASNGSGTRVFDFAYNPYNANYELHMNISSNLTTTDGSAWNGTYIGARLQNPYAVPSSAQYGGIWMTIRHDGASFLYTGSGHSKDNDGFGTVWNEPLAITYLPESFQSEHKMIVVDSGDVIRYYMITHNPGNRHLICTVNVEPDYGLIAVRDSTGNFLYSGFAKIGHTGYFGIWTHNAASTQNNISVQCAKK